MCAIIQMEWLSASFTVLVYFLQQSVDLNGRKRESRLKAREPLGTPQVGGKSREPAAVGLPRMSRATMSASSEGLVKVRTGNQFIKSDRVSSAL